MRKCLATGVLFLTVLSAVAQSPKPAASVKVKIKARSGYLSKPMIMTPDNSVLLLLPQRDDRWTLERVIGWDTAKPKVQTLDVPGIGKSNRRVRATLKLGGDNRYLFVRIEMSTFDTSLHSRASVAIVDLQSFTLVVHKVTTALLLAGSDLIYEPSGDLLASGFVQERQPDNSLSRKYNVGIFKLPSLQPSLNCQFDEVLRLGQHGWENTISAADECAALLTAAHLGSVKEIVTSDLPAVLPNIIVEPSCFLIELSSDKTLALFQCRVTKSYGADEFVTIMKSNSLDVYTVRTGTRIFSLPLSHNYEQYPTVLTSSEGKSVLLLLRNNALETYLLQ